MSFKINYVIIFMRVGYMKRKFILIFLGILIIFFSSFLGLYFISKDKLNNSLNTNNTIHSLNNFENSFINKIIFDKNENVLVSPLSIAYALSMVKEGASGNTLKELENALNNYKLSSMQSIPNVMSITNSIFIKDSFKSSVNSVYVNTLGINYRSQVYYDSFKVVDNINNYVKDKTFNMIPNFLSNDDITEETLLLLINALAINLKWENEFDCNKTTKSIFYLNDGHTMDTFMMHSNEKYIENDDVYGFIKDYATYDENGNISDNGNTFEFIALLPKNNLNEALSKISNNYIFELEETYSENIDISFPRFSYEYKITNLIEVLKKMGINDLFTKKCNLSKISDDLYVSNAIQKTFIDLNERGTKASASTGIILDKYTTVEENHELIFNKQFIYIIKEKNKENIWFIGIVNRPTMYDENNNIC